MHRGWDIPEVLRMILEQVSPNTDPGAKTLSRLARTCHQLLEPSLDALWREQHSFLPLLRCLPDVWEDPASDELILDAVVVPESWNRALFYSKRIKRLLLNPFDEALTLEIFEFFSMSVPDEYLMPNLQHLYWNPGDDDIFPFIRLFLGPSLTSIDIMLSGNISRLSLLPLIVCKYPRLAHLKVLTPKYYDMDSSLVCHALSNAIPSLIRLETLHVQRIEALPHLASLQTLRSLIIADLNSTTFLKTHANRAQRPFSALQTLHLYQVSKIAAALSILDVLPPNAGLVDCHITSTYAVAKDSVFVLLSSLRDHCASSTLTALTLDVSANVATASTQSTRFLADTLRPLLSFLNLSNVNIKSAGYFCLEDDFIMALATAWPRLTSLTLCRGTPRADRHEPPLTPSILAIRAFAMHCPHLAYLRIPLNGKATSPRADDAPHQHRRRCTQTALEKLIVDDAAIDNPQRSEWMDVARFLSCTFPRLRVIATTPRREADSARDARDDRVRWQKMEQMLPLLAAVRMEEETYWRGELADSPS
ncbi:hypothetical protein C8R46DRAFT_1203554 [Mycena filopes]|nr:hypothetical protein C8R46DRAFT_1203554 [Mycena filopes]